MASRVVKFYFGVQNLPKGRTGKNYVQVNCQETFVNFVNKAFLSFSAPKIWLSGDSFFDFTKNYLLKIRQNTLKNEKRPNQRLSERWHQTKPADSTFSSLGISHKATLCNGISQ
ncbi:MAG: hypothetical protein KF734_13640 [Saprospiraceae bacterium]|nr:hypothetical protein [Saprospiraceae bacterium]